MGNRSYYNPLSRTPSRTGTARGKDPRFEAWDLPQKPKQFKSVILMSNGSKTNSRGPQMLAIYFGGSLGTTCKGRFGGNSGRAACKQDGACQARCSDL